mgnify:CR=1 FL=1
MKKIGIFGSWHLATVIAGCMLKQNYDVTLVDYESENINKLNNNKLPIYEPYLIEIFKQNLKKKKIRFLNNIGNSFERIDTIILAKDVTKTKTGVDLSEIKKSIKIISKSKQKSFTLIISSQLPVGTSKEIEKSINYSRKNKLIHFAYIPEFLRLGTAVDDFTYQDYTIIGCENSETFKKCKSIYKHFSKNIFEMKLSEAEMAKHIANIYVATSVSLIAEMTKVAEKMNINLLPVSKALRYDKRIGKKSYILPGLGFTGGNLERDINVIKNLLKENGEKPIFLNAVTKTNDYHNNIILRKLEKIFKNFNNLKISFLGITYKSFTTTTVGSLTLKIGKQLQLRGSEIFAYDPLISKKHNFKINKITISKSITDCINNSDALIIMIDKPEFKNLSANFLKTKLRKKIIIDATNSINPKNYFKNKFYFTGIGYKTNKKLS